jgi:rhodanese-related sulfurtransferase
MGAGETGRPSGITRHTGKIDSLSRKAGTIFLIVDTGAGAQTVVVRFDDATSGVDELSQGHFVTVECELRKGETYATKVQRVLATLPKGVADLDTGPAGVIAIPGRQKPVDGEVSLAEFRQALNGGGKDVLFIDVRNADELSDQGMIAGAVNIPLDTLPARRATLPRDKTMYIYCATGARAKMAYKELAGAGFKAKFLRMNLEELVAALPRG